ncbi:MAG: hypothetical protein ACKVKL_15535 [Pseudomonadales bacterium]|jgi:uncharacterized protein YunC (DUF1805 family)
MSATTGAYPEGQVLRYSSKRGRILTMDTAYMVCAGNIGDVVVNASYCGVLPARFIGQYRPRGSIGIDCAVGPAGASIAGLWFLEALNIPAAAADVATVLLGDGIDLCERGVISFVNHPAALAGVEFGMTVRDAALKMLEASSEMQSPDEVINRVEIYRNSKGRAVICTDSIAFGLPEDCKNVLVTAGHSGRSALPYFLKVMPHAFICSDGGMGRDASGVKGMHQAAEYGLPGAAVDARSAMMGSGISTYRDGTISAVNKIAQAMGVEVGTSAAEAAVLLADLERPGPD